METGSGSGNGTWLTGEDGLIALWIKILQALILLVSLDVGRKWNLSNLFEDLLGAEFHDPARTSPFDHLQRRTTRLENLASLDSSGGGEPRLPSALP
jgi:hypothetical protein